MGQLLEGFTGWHVDSSAEGMDLLRSMHSRSELVRTLSGKERQIVMLAVTYMRVPHIAQVLALPPAEVRRTLNRVKQRVGVRYLHELVEMVRMTQIAWEPTQAQALFLFTQHNLIGATIKGGVVQDSEWFGLLLDMPDGQSKTAWFTSNRNGSHSAGWIELEDA